MAVPRGGDALLGLESAPAEFVDDVPLPGALYAAKINTSGYPGCLSAPGISSTGEPFERQHFAGRAFCPQLMGLIGR